MKKRVMFVSSSGGHLSELLCLEPLFNSYDYILVTEKTSSTKKLKDKYNIKYVVYGSRRYIFKYIFVFLINVFKFIYFMLRYRPQTIVTTGAHTGGIACVIGKMFKAKVIYIESLAKVNTLSVTGRNVYKFADKFYVQWKDLLKFYPKAEYIGRLM